MIAWDIDGPGGLAEVVVAGGDFSTIGGSAARGIALWDPVSSAWYPLAGGIDGTVRALAIDAAGELIVGGTFAAAGSVPAANIARWNGGYWSSVGAGIDGTVYALTVMPGGEIVAGGTFATAGGVAAGSIAQFGANGWTSVGGQMAGAGAVVRALTVSSGGDLIAGGLFSSLGGVAANSLARWNGGSWESIWSTTGSAFVMALGVADNGDLLVGGYFNGLGGTGGASVARWDGTSWDAIGSGGNGTVLALAELGNGDLVAAGDFSSIGGVEAHSIAHWDGTAWSPMDEGMSFGINCLVVPSSGELLAGQLQAMRWDGAEWSVLGASGGPVGSIAAIDELPDGSIVAGGRFTAAGDRIVDCAARWDGSAWHGMGSLGVYSGSVEHLVARDDGSVIAGGDGLVTRWDGTGWNSMGSLDGRIDAMERAPNGDVVVGGTFTHIGGLFASRFARWDGATWHAMSAPLLGLTSSTLTIRANGDVIASGYFPSALFGPYVLARWTGSGWTAFAPGSSAIKCLVELPNGDLLAGGTFASLGGSPINRLARWDGNSWTQFAGGVSGGTNCSVNDLEVTPNGSVVVVGRFQAAGGVAAAGAACWDGSAWSPVSGGLDDGVGLVAEFRGSQLLIGGEFRSVGGVACGNLLRVSTDCLPDVTPLGAGCPSSGGSNTLTVDAPWAGAMWRSTATGLPPAALLFVVDGFATTSTSLDTFFATAQPGCTLHVAPESVGLAIGGGQATLTAKLPRNPALAGVVWHRQIVSMALDPTLSVTTTNALSMTIGFF